MINIGNLSIADMYVANMQAERAYLGSLLIYDNEGPTPPTPTGYTFLDYLGADANSSAYLETNYTPTVSTVIKTKFYLYSGTGDMLIGTDMSNDDWDWRFFDNDSLFWDWGNDRMNNFSQYYTNCTVEVEIGNYYVSNLATGAMIMQGGTKDYIPELGTIKVLREQPNSHYSGFFHYIDIYEGSTLVRKFRPARRNSDNVLGFYEEITDTFFPSANSDTYNIVGPEDPFFYLQPRIAGDYAIAADDIIWKQKDSFEYSTDKENWTAVSALPTTSTTVSYTPSQYLAANDKSVVLALAISAYNTEIVGNGYEVRCYDQNGNTGAGSSTGSETTLLSTDENYAYYVYTRTTGVSMSTSDRYRWMINRANAGSYVYRANQLTATYRYMEWNGANNNGSVVEPSALTNIIYSNTLILPEDPITLTANQKLYLRNTSGLTLSSGSSASNPLFNSVQSVSYNIGGDLNSLYDYTNYSRSGLAASWLFNNQSNLCDASKLELLNGLVSSCYHSMFQNCSSLTIAPELPATSLVSYCYYGMFQNCGSLTAAPALPATSLANNCYQIMFKNCSSLTIAPELPATSLADNCYYGMFQNCGSLTAAPALPATSLVSYCYYYMFRDCGSLTIAPELPATTLDRNCYYGMFYNCGSLTVAPELPATSLAVSCYTNMFYNCGSLTVAPELPATSLVSYCYNSLFRGCSSLSTLTCLAKTVNGSAINSSNLSSASATTSWVQYVPSAGTFYCVSGVSWPNGSQGCPSGWTRTYVTQ